jgi:hypothetical protein
MRRGPACCPLAAAALLLLLCGGTGRGNEVPGDQLLRIQVRSGRVFAGRLDARTSGAQLWLRSGDAQAAIVRPIDWERIVAAEVGGKRLTAEAFRAWASAQAAGENASRQAAEGGSPGQASAVVQGRSPSGAPQAADSRATRPATVPPAGVPRGIVRPIPRVESLAIDAYLASWNADPLPDGLVVHLWPQGADGHVWPVDGTVEVTLLAPVRGHATLQTILRRSAVIRPWDYGPQGAVVRLAFQSVHPERDTAVATRGVVQVKFAVAGHGVLHATLSDVRIRQASAMRDRQQQQTGQRLLPGEVPPAR